MLLNIVWQIEETKGEKKKTVKKENRRTYSKTSRTVRIFKIY